MDTKQLVKYTRNFNVLYIEDEESLRLSTKEILENYFNHLDVSSDGKDGFDKYRNFYEEHNKFYDIVISDLLMAGMSGEELSNLIMNFNQNQEIIIISGKADFEQIVRLINLGVNKFISKPVNYEELQSVIYDVALNIRTKQLKEKEKEEIAEYNGILKIREDENLDKLQRKVKELEEFSSALDSSAIVVKTDTNGIITYVNDKFCDASGYTKEELVGNNNNMLKSGNRSKSFFKKLWNTINAKKIYKTLFQNRRKDGSMYHIETVINPIVDIDGEIVEFIAVSHDMTQLMLSIENAKKAEKSKEEFFMNISHEMRTPLNSIIGFSSILQKRVKDDDKASMMVNKILETGHELEKLVESVLDMREINKKTLTLKEANFNPTELLNVCFSKYIQWTQSKFQSLEISIDSNLPSSLFGDPLRVAQVLYAILDNAVKFTPEGGKIDIRAYYDTLDEMLVCEVQDNGKGISKEDQKKIFGFNQLDASVSRLHEGAGIGLSVASGIIEAMNGKISLKSALHMGSLFKVEFPLKQS